MKILYHIPYPDGMGDDRFIYDGYRHAFEDLGHQVFPFTERDVLESALALHRPDLFITSFTIIDFSKEATIMKKFRENGGKIIFRAGYLWPEKANYARFIELVRSDMLADFYCSECIVPKENFEALTGHPCLRLPLAADKTIHFPTKPDKKYECDIIFVGANLPLKREKFKRRLHPLFKKYRVKVFGGDWDFADKYVLHPLAKIDRILNLGGVFAKWRINRQVPLNEENVAYSSAKISLNFHEDNLLIGPNSRIFKIPASGGFEICDPIPMLRDYFTEDEMVMPATDEEFFKQVDYYLSHEAERKAMQERATRRAQRDHTWHNRAQTMLAWYRESLR